MAKFRFAPVIPTDAISAKLGTAGGFYNDADVGKAVKLGGDSAYVLCAVDNRIEGFIQSIETATQDNHTFGSVACPRFVRCAASGAVAVGNYVVSAGNAQGADIQYPLVKAKADANTGPFVWRCVSVYPDGSVVIERIS